MFKKLKAKFTKYITRVEVRDVVWFTCDSAVIKVTGPTLNRKYMEFPDGLRIIIENGKYVGFYTQEPPV